MSRSDGYSGLVNSTLERKVRAPQNRMLLNEVRPAFADYGKCNRK